MVALDAGHGTANLIEDLSRFGTADIEEYVLYFQAQPTEYFALFVGQRRRYVNQG